MEREVYSAFVQLVMHAESTSWNRFYNYLMATTILILSWATLFTNDPDKTSPKIILISICLIGIISGVLWAALGYRGRRFLNEYSNAGANIERNSELWQGELQNLAPLTLSRELRDRLPFRYAGSLYLLTGVPMVFSLLFVIMLIISF